MELKKSPKADLTNKRSIFILFGLVISLGITIIIFSWSQSEQIISQMKSNMTAAEQELIEVTVQEDEPEPEPEKAKPTAVSELINIVKNDTKINTDMSMFDEMDEIDLDTDFSYSGDYAEGEIEEETPVIFAEQDALFNGEDGRVAFSRWCQKNLAYPQIALDNGVQGRVIIEFVIEKDGRLTSIRLVRGVDRELDKAALDIVRRAPKEWAPAKNNGRPVRIKIQIPIGFKIQSY